MLGLIFTDEITRVFALGFDNETLRLASMFTKVTLFGMYFSSIFYIFSGYMQIKGKYYTIAMSGFVLNFVIILSIVLSYNINIIILPIGNVMAILMQVIFVFYFTKKEGYNYSFDFQIGNPLIKKIIRLSIPLTIGVTISQINTLIDRTMASQVIIGGISALNYANRLNEFVQGIFVLSFSTVLYPLISKAVINEDLVLVKKYLFETFNYVNIILIPITIGAMVLSKPIISLLFGRGEFDSSAIALTSSALFFYSIGIIGFSHREILSRVYYAFNDTKTPIIFGAVSTVINIILNIILSKIMGIGGLALATSISAIFCSGMLFIKLKHIIESLETKKIVIDFLKMMGVALLMGGIVKILYINLENRYNLGISLLFSVIIGALIYVIGIYLVNIDEVHEIVNLTKAKLFKHR